MKEKIKSISLGYLGVFIGFFVINVLVFNKVDYIARTIIIFAIGYLILLFGMFIYYLIFGAKDKE